MTDEEYGRTICRTVPIVVKPTVVEIADIIWHMNADEQIVLLSCLKRRFCNKEAGLTQMAEIANALKELPNEAHRKAIQEGKLGSTFCMLECNPSHICFEPKE